MRITIKELGDVTLEHTEFCSICVIHYCAPEGHVAELILKNGRSHQSKMCTIEEADEVKQSVLDQFDEVDSAAKKVEDEYIKRWTSRREEQEDGQGDDQVLPVFQNIQPDNEPEEISHSKSMIQSIREWWW